MSEQSSVICLPVLVEIKTAQAQHGLKHGDYQRYRQYCTRKLHRLRESVNLKCGKKSFQPKPIDEHVLSNERHLMIPLFQAERCWAYAMQLRQDANKVPRKTHHSRQRLRKAAKYAELLERLASVEGKVDARTALEAQAYSKYMGGMLAFELQDWEEALRSLNFAKKIWSQFAEAVNPEERLFYTQRLEEIEANIRYCAYSLGDSSALNDIMHMDSTDEMLASRLNAALATQAQSLHQLKWRGKNIPVHSEKLRVALMRIQDKEQELNEGLSSPAADKSVLSLFDRLIMELQDAYTAYQDEARGATVKAKGASSGQKPSEELGAYLQFIRLETVNKRSRHMIEYPAGGKPNKPEENVRLLDTIMQNLGIMAELPGVGDDTQLVTELDAQRAVARAQRCLYVAYAYLAAHKYADASALFDRTIEHVGAALATPSLASNQEMVGALQGVAREARGAKCQVRARMFLDGVPGDLDRQRQKLPLSERLGQYAEPDENVVITRFPPGLEPIPCKPFFFDVALNHIPVPDVSDRAKESAGGISGLVSGLFGWGKKSS